jgi:hypothetical protein
MGLIALPRESELRVPLPKHFAQLIPQYGKAAKLLLEILQLRGSERADLLAGRSAFLPDFHESCQFIQSEPDGERMLHEPYPIQGLRRVLTIAVGGAPGMEKAFAFIVAKRVRAQVRKMGQFRGSEIANGIIFLHKYGI